MYRLSQTEQSEDIGSKGEQLAVFLSRHLNDDVQAPRLDGRHWVVPLVEALNYWLSAFGLAESVSAEEIRYGYELQVRPPDLDRNVNVTNVGVGLSQVLPVLARVLLAEPGSVILLEQPELHLHPAMQQHLGDFLLAAARSGRQLIVETHSDHLVSRLRRRIAEDNGGDLRGFVDLIYVWREEGRSTYRSVGVNDYGGIDDWPPGFFDQTATEAQAILRAGIEKKKSQQQ